MSAILGGSVGETTASAVAAALLESDVESILEEKNQLISRQYAEIERLQRELAEVVGERDALLCEVSKFKFEREMTDLKRLHDESFSSKVERPLTSHNNANHQIHGNSMHGAYSTSGSQTSLTTTSYITGQSYMQSQNYGAPYPSAQHYPHSTTSYSQPQSYGTMVQGFGGQPQSAGYQQNHLKKGPVRNGDVLKRCRLQTAYELSQDLLDKQIEMLERKYGGVKARNAALTIQRAFRRYTLLKKFAAITAMAKAEKRLSRKLQEATDRSGNLNDHERMLYHSQIYIQQAQPANRPMPIRSMSLRERRHVDTSQSPIPRSQSSRCEIPVSSHQHTNHSMHQSGGRHTPSLAPSPCNRHQQLPPSPCWESSSQESGSSIHYYNPQEALCGLRQETPPRDLLRTPCTSPSTPHNLQMTISQNWNNASQLGSGRTRGSSGRKIPPEVPKRTSSITSRSMEPRHNGLSKSVENGSLSSVQSSGSDSTNCESSEGDAQRGSPVWKHKGISSSPEHQECASHNTDATTMATNVKDLGHSHASSGYQLPPIDHAESGLPSQTSYKVSETVRKRQYRVGLNLFNKKPERGISYLIRRGFLENSPQGVARFLISRKGLSKQMIGEYLGNLQNTFNMAVLECFSHELDLSGMQVDVALRKFQAYFRMPGEAQKIERLMEVFSQRYCQCNPDVVSRLRSADTVFVLAFAIIMLNTDLHTPNLKPERRMRLEDFIKNLRGIDDCGDIDRDILVGIYERVKDNEFKPGSDHVSQVMKVQATIVGKKPNMALPHRRLVCYCRLYEIPDIHKKERPGVHQREVFLFNDLLVVTKILSKKKNSVTYTFRQSFPLCGMIVTLFEVPHYPYGIRLSQRVDGKVLVTFNARNEHDRCKFVEDLRESISEMDEMETLRIETELERQKSSRGARGGAENRDSGVADVEICPCPGTCSDRAETVDVDTQLKRSALSNSLLDIHEQFAGEKPQRRGSVGSLDSALLVFCVPSESGEKVTLGISALLSMTVFLMTIRETLPPTEKTPLISLYYGVSICLVSFASALAVVTLNLHHRGVRGIQVPNIVRSLVLDKLSRIVFLNIQEENRSIRTLSCYFTKKEKVFPCCETVSKHYYTPLFRSIEKLRRDCQSRDHRDLLYQQESAEQFPRRKNSCPLHFRPESSEQHVSSKYSSRRDDSNSTSPSLDLRREGGLEAQWFRVLGRVYATIERNEWRLVEQDRRERTELDWKQVALVSDRVLLCIFLFITVVSTTVILCGSPPPIPELPKSE